MTEEEIKAAIREVYASKVEESNQFYPYCFASHNEFGTFGQSEAMGYSSNELETIPNESVMGLGCGNPVSWARINRGDTVLDLGSGGGIDSFLAARRVGDDGLVIGIDMTQEMIVKARTTAAHYGYRNVEFRMGEIENLPVDSDSIDVVISNCVINLSPNKQQAFEEAFRALKPGGLLVVSDAVASGKSSLYEHENVETWIERAGGAMRKNDLLAEMDKVGFESVSVETERDFNTIENGQSDSGFTVNSITVSAMKPK